MKSLSFQTKKEIVVAILFAIIIVVLIIGIIDVGIANDPNSTAKTLVRSGFAKFTPWQGSLATQPTIMHRSVRKPGHRKYGDLS